MSGESVLQHVVKPPKLEHAQTQNQQMGEPSVLDLPLTVATINGVLVSRTSILEQGRNANGVLHSTSLLPYHVYRICPISMRAHYLRTGNQRHIAKTKKQGKK